MTIMEKGALARALYTNHPETKNELFFRKGDILTVIERDFDGQPGWWLCALRGQRGICPSNYLEVLEDKYSIPNANTIGRKNLEGAAPLYMNDPCGKRGRQDESVAEYQNSNAIPESPPPSSSTPTTTDFVDPLETYDFPRSVEPVLVSSQQQKNSSLLRGKCSSVSALVSSKNTKHPSTTATAASLPHLHHLGSSVDEEDEDEHTYSNDLPDFAEIKNEKDEPLYMNDSPKKNSKSEEEKFGEFLTKTSPLDLYDVPRNELPIYGQSLTRLRKYGSCSTGEELGTGQRSTYRGKSLSSLNVINSSGSSTTSSNSGVQLRKNPGTRRHFPFQRSNRSSVESGIGMGHQQNSMEASQTDLYDVPRGTTFQAPQIVVASSSSSSTSNGHSRNGLAGQSRPPSALSYTSSGMGMSIATSESKDSLDCLYDVPRNTIKAYVNHIETKYDDVMAARKRHDSSSSTSSSQNQNRVGNGQSQGHHTRHNSTSSIFSAYGYTRKQSVGEVTSRSGAGTVDPMDLYDVPRGTSSHSTTNHSHHHHQRRPSCSSTSSNGSLNGGGGTDDPMMFYDIPSQFARKVSLPSSSMSSLNGSQFSLGRSNGNLRESTNSISNGVSHSPAPAVVLRRHGDEITSADVKILPLGPKAAVSVCEKLRQEVVSSIGAILSHVKPKWRTKENLTEIMPDLKFSCTRLCLAIKDVADFASRSLSNAKRLHDDPLIATRLHRLLTPVINGSQIIQRDVDELDAYFWSVDRLSVSGDSTLPSISFSAGSSTSHNQSSQQNTDALDQLILCSRSLKHDVTELANFLALHSTALYREGAITVSQKNDTSSSTSRAASVQSFASAVSVPNLSETKVEDTQEDYDYVSLVPNSGNRAESESGSNSVDSQKLSSASSTSTVSWHLDSRDQQLLEFYSAQISVTAPQLSQSIATFISAIQQNEPPSVFNIHLKYVILLGYKLLFAGDTVHRNIGNPMLKEEVELKANELHKSILSLYETSKVATVEFPKMGPMQQIVDKIWQTTQAATQLKKVIFNAVYTPV